MRLIKIPTGDYSLIDRRDVRTGLLIYDESISVAIGFVQEAEHRSTGKNMYSVSRVRAVDGLAMPAYNTLEALLLAIQGLAVGLVLYKIIP